MMVHASQRTLTHKGVEYMLGSAGSLILNCPRGCEERFRPPINYFGPPPRGSPLWHKCMTCQSHMTPIKATGKGD